MMFVEKDSLKEYKCNGDFSFENENKFNLDFSLVQYCDGEMQLTAYLDSNQYNQLSVIMAENHCVCSIDGKLTDGSGKIFVESAFLKAIPKNANFHVFSDVIVTYDDSSNYDNIRFGLLNFLNNDNSFGNFMGFECQMKDYSIRFEGISKYKYFEELLKEGVLPSALTSYASVNTNDEVRDDLEKLTYFLSYINRTPIYSVNEEYYSSDNLVKTVLCYNPKRNFSYNVKLIGAENLSNVVCKYLDNFLKYYSDFSLNIVISIFLEGLNIIYSDIGYMLMEMSLETFLEKYEQFCKDKGNIIPNSAFENKKSVLCDFLASHDFEVMEEDLNQLANDLSPDYPNVWDKFTHLRKNEKFKKNLKHQEGDDYFQTIRNKIAHTGEFPKTIHSDNKKMNIADEFERLVYLIDRIILTLIGFEGSFFKIHGDEVEL